MCYVYVFVNISFKFQIMMCEDGVWFFFSILEDVQCRLCASNVPSIHNSLFEER
eukprot:m.140834 g.140834  ORF g.140834 m.140834 type:complete len:54 (-) comp13187_c0_seq4:1183-1344(-)